MLLLTGFTGSHQASRCAENVEMKAGVKVIESLAIIDVPRALITGEYTAVPHHLFAHLLLRHTQQLERIAVHTSAQATQ